MNPACGGDQLLGCTVAQAAAAMDAAAGLHGPRWGDTSLNDCAWLSREELIPAFIENYRTMVEPFCERYAETLPGDVTQVARHFGQHIRAYYAQQRRPWTIAHGDFRPDNMLFAARGGTLPVVVLDWQTTTLSPGVTDVSYFLGAGLLEKTRQQEEESLLRRYHEGLRAHGVRDYSWQTCWRDYRFFAAQGLITAVCAAMQTTPDPRSDKMFTAMAQRHARQMLDLGTLDLLNSG
jgi:aminoglycoside phosphotransferase (APT) family kinase protein